MHAYLFRSIKRSVALFGMYPLEVWRL